MRFKVLPYSSVNAINKEIERLSDLGYVIEDVVISTGKLGTYTVIKYRK